MKENSKGTGHGSGSIKRVLERAYVKAGQVNQLHDPEMHKTGQAHLRV
jgi:hypothetical protein